MARLLYADGSAKTLASSGPFSLKELQVLVAENGPIDMMTLSSDCVLIFDDEGKLKNAPYNKAATDLVVAHANIDSYGDPGGWSRDLGQPKDFFVGTVLVCSNKELT